MSDDLVKRLRGDWFGYDVSLRAIDAMDEAADRIEQLTAERDGLLRCVTDNHVALCRAEKAEAERDEALNQLDSATHSVEVLEKRVAKFMAERDQLRAALEDIADHDTGATAGLAYTARAALKGESND